jgi:hypothetical protein
MYTENSNHSENKFTYSPLLRNMDMNSRERGYDGPNYLDYDFLKSNNFDYNKLALFADFPTGKVEKVSSKVRRPEILQKKPMVANFLGLENKQSAKQDGKLNPPE